MQENALKKAVRENRVAVGTVLAELGTRGIAKLMEYADLDWVTIDMERGGYSIDNVGDLIAWFKATEIAVLVRPPENLYHMLSGIMDAGAMGVQVGGIESAADLRPIVEAVMYPPLGNRGVGINAAHSDFKKPKAAEYMPARNAQTTVVAMVDTQKALDNIDEIAAVEGVDVIRPVPNSAWVSVGGRPPKFPGGLAKIAEACKRHGKALMYHPTCDADIVELYKLGCRVMSLDAANVVFQDALRAETDHLREHVASLAGAR